MEIIIILFAFLHCNANNNYLHCFSNITSPIEIIIIYIASLLLYCLIVASCDEQIAHVSFDLKYNSDHSYCQWWPIVANVSQFHPIWLRGFIKFYWDSDHYYCWITSLWRILPTWLYSQKKVSSLGSARILTRYFCSLNGLILRRKSTLLLLLDYDRTFD